MNFSDVLVFTGPLSGLKVSENKIEHTFLSNINQSKVRTITLSIIDDFRRHRK